MKRRNGLQKDLNCKLYRFSFLELICSYSVKNSNILPRSCLLCLVIIENHIEFNVRALRFARWQTIFSAILQDIRSNA